MKKFKSLKLMLIGLFAVMSVNAFAADGYTKLFKFTHDGTNATITGFNTALTDADKAAIEIPQTVKDVVTGKDLKVTGIGEGAFKNEGKINTVTIKHSNLASIGASAFEGCGGLTAIDFSAATGLKTIGASAFKGTKISNLNLEKTAVAVIENLFGTTFAYTIKGTNYTEGEANEINAALLGDKAVTTDMLDPAQYKYYNTTNEANAKNATLDGAIAEGDEIPYTMATANDYNKANFGGVVEGDQKEYTVETAGAYNATLTGAMQAGQELDAFTAELWNQKVGSGTMTAAEATTAANEYNATLPGAVKKGDYVDSETETYGNHTEAYEFNMKLHNTIDNPYFNPTTTDEYKDGINAILAVIPGAHYKGDGDCTETKAAWDLNMATYGPGGTSENDDFPFLPQPTTTAEYQTANNAMVAMYDDAVKKGDPKKVLIASTNAAKAYNAALPGAKTADDILNALDKSIGDVLTQADADAYNSLLTGAVAPGDLAVDENGDPIEFTEEEAYGFNMGLGVPGLAVIGNSTGVVADAAAANAYNAGLEGAVKKHDIDKDNSPKYDDHGVYVENEKNARGKTGHVDTSMKKADEKIAENKNTNLTSVKLNGAWTKINDKAFEACTKLESVDFNAAAKTADKQPQRINNRAFLGTAVKEFNFEKTNVTSVPGDFFVTEAPTTDPVDYDKNATLTTVKFNKIWSSVKESTFEDCTALATVTFEEREVATESEPGKPVTFKASFNGIEKLAFANTAIAEIEIPQALSPSSAKSSIAAQAFSGCTNLKSFTYVVDNNATTVNFIVDALAFVGCKDVIYYTTNANVAAYMATTPDPTPAPKNSSFVLISDDEGAYVTPFKPVKYKNAEKWYIKYKAVGDIKVDKNEAKVYNAYLDDDDKTLNMCLYRVSGGYYKIKAGETVLILTTNPDLTFEAGSGSTSMLPTGFTNAMNIVTSAEGVKRSTLDFAAGADKVIYGWVNSATAGTGWQMITTGDVFPQGTLYILAAEQTAGNRLNVRWLDEDGNVEAETTGIESIFGDEVTSDSDAIYNLQGVRVNKAEKGVFIKNGKKYVK